MALKLCCCAIVFSIAGVAVGTGEDEERLVGAPNMAEELLPAAFGIRTDKQGGAWDIGADASIGRVGSTMVNHGIVLEVNGNEFVSNQPLMTRDGKEFVLDGEAFDAVPGLEVQRRVRLFDEEGILRYVDSFFNGSANPVTLDIALKTNFSGNYQTFVSDQGRIEPVVLDETESGIVVSPGPGQANRAFVFTLVDSGSELRPSISSQNRFALTFQYRLKLEGGESVALLHAAAQVIIPQIYDRQARLKLFQPLTFEAILSMEPNQPWRRYLVNARSETSILEEADDWLGSFEIDRQEKDVLAIGEKTRLVGTASSDGLSISSAYGKAAINLEKVAGISGGNGRQSQKPRVFLRDGQVFTAAIEAPGLKFEQTGGGNIELDISSLDRLLMGEPSRDTDWKEGALAMIETHEGDRIRVRESSNLLLSGVTPWGRLPIRLNELVALGEAPRGMGGYMVELLNGSRCLVFLSDESYSLDLDLYGEVELNRSSVKEVSTVMKRSRSDLLREAGMHAIVSLRGDQTVVADIGDSTLPVVSEGVLIDTAVSEIKRIDKLDRPVISAGGVSESPALFELERWDGGVINGVVALDVLSLRVGDEVWQVPFSDIETIRTPWPSPDKETQTEIEKLLMLLSSQEWKERERATRELAGFGYLARPLLQREFANSDDLEVTRRLGRILSNLN